MKTHKIIAAGITSLICLLLIGQAHANAQYVNAGLVNPVTYNFTATNTGTLNAYFAGSTAGYEETITIFDSTLGTSVTGLNDHSSVVGDFIGLAVNAGDTIVFYNNVLTSGDTWSSIVAQNWDGMNHVYSVAYTSGETLNNIATTPNSLNVSGTYVAFEDLSRYSSDLNYHDDTFVFTNVSTNGVPGADVPEPASITLLATGLLGFGVSRRKKNQA